MTKKYSQEEWDQLIEKYPPGTPVSGTVSNQQTYGVWLVLGELPDVPALLEIIHFEINETIPKHRIQLDDYPAVGTLINTRILWWSKRPKDVRLTQLTHDWSEVAQRMKDEGK